MCKIDRRGGVHKLYTRTDSDALFHDVDHLTIQYKSVLSAALGPLACPGRGARPSNRLYLTLKYCILVMYKLIGGGRGPKIVQ